MPARKRPGTDRSTGSLNLESALIIALMVLIAAGTLLLLGDSIACSFARSAAEVRLADFRGGPPSVDQAAGTVSWPGEGGGGTFTVWAADPDAVGFDPEDAGDWRSLGTTAGNSLAGLAIAPDELVFVSLSFRSGCTADITTTRWPDGGAVPGDPGTGSGPVRELRLLDGTPDGSGRLLSYVVDLPNDIPASAYPLQVTVESVVDAFAPTAGSVTLTVASDLQEFAYPAPAAGSPWETYPRIAAELEYEGDAVVSNEWEPKDPDSWSTTLPRDPVSVTLPDPAFDDPADLPADDRSVVDELSGALVSADTTRGATFATNAGSVVFRRGIGTADPPFNGYQVRGDSYGRTDTGNKYVSLSGTNRSLNIPAAGSTNYLTMAAFAHWRHVFPGDGLAGRHVSGSQHAWTSHMNLSGFTAPTVPAGPSTQSFTMYGAPLISGDSWTARRYTDGTLDPFAVEQYAYTLAAMRRGEDGVAHLDYRSMQPVSGRPGEYGVASASLTANVGWSMNFYSTVASTDPNTAARFLATAAHPGDSLGVSIVPPDTGAFGPNTTAARDLAVTQWNALGGPDYDRTLRWSGVMVTSYSSSAIEYWRMKRQAGN